MVQAGNETNGAMTGLDGDFVIEVPVGSALSVSYIGYKSIEVAASVNNSVFNGYRFTPAHYLSPLGQGTFRKTATDESNLETSVVYQNPGWSRVSGTAPDLSVQ